MSWQRIVHARFIDLSQGDRPGEFVPASIRRSALEELGTLLGENAPAPAGVEKVGPVDLEIRWPRLALWFTTLGSYASLEGDGWYTLDSCAEYARTLIDD